MKLFSLVNLFRRLSQIAFYLKKDFLVLGDASFLLKDFLIPYAKNLEMDNFNFSPKHGKLKDSGIKIVVTKLVRNMCITVLTKREIVSNLGTAELIVNKVFSDKIFIDGSCIDYFTTPKMFKDFHESDKKYEDGMIISTADYYGIPIITAESKNIELWNNNCNQKVICCPDFWKIIDKLKQEIKMTKKLMKQEFRKLNDNSV